MIPNSYRSALKYLFFVGLIIGLNTACSKDDKGEDPIVYDNDPSATDEAVFNKIITVKNLGKEVGAAPESSLFFSLENNKVIPLAQQHTNRWDISIGAVYDSFFGGNNGQNKKNLGFGGSGKGGVICLAKPFDEVIDIPKDSEFNTGSHIVGTDDSGDLGQGLGYYIYDFNGTIKGDGSEEKKHVAYALPESRTIIIRTAKGHYAKIEVQSLYKDLLNPADWKKSSPHTFLTFRYTIAKAGSTKFTVKN